MLQLEYAIPRGYSDEPCRRRRRVNPLVGRAIGVVLFAGALTMFVVALDLPAWYFTTPMIPCGGEQPHTWSGWKCLHYGFMFYPSNLLLWCVSIYGLIATVVDWRQPLERARGMSGDFMPLYLWSTAWVFVCGYLARPLKTPGCGLWMASHVAYTVAAAIRVREVRPYRGRSRIQVEELSKATRRIEVAEPWRAVEALHAMARQAEEI